MHGTAEIDDLEPVYMVAYAIDDFGYIYNGIYSGIQYLAYESPELLRAMLTLIAAEEPDSNRGIDKVVSIFTIPKLAFNGTDISNTALDKDFKATPRTVNLKNTPTSLNRLYTKK